MLRLKTRICTGALTKWNIPIVSALDFWDKTYFAHHSLDGLPTSHWLSIKWSWESISVGLFKSVRHVEQWVYVGATETRKSRCNTLKCIMQQTVLELSSQEHKLASGFGKAVERIWVQGGSATKQYHSQTPHCPQAHFFCQFPLLRYLLKSRIWQQRSSGLEEGGAYFVQTMSSCFYLFRELVALTFLVTL